MKKTFLLLILITFFYNYAQVDYSDSWEDFYSYNNVKNFVKVDNKIYAIVDNAVFIYDTNTLTNKKISSINGLSGGSISALFYDQEFNLIVLGYETGLLEVINNLTGKITVANDIERLTGEGSKRINHFSKHGNKLYLATDFAIVQYNIESLEFGDTYRIALGSTAVKVNQTIVFNDTIYAATQNGIYTANINDPFLIDFNNWVLPQGNFIGNFTAITVFNNKVYTSRGKNLYEITSINYLQNIQNFTTPILNLNATTNFFNVTTLKKVYIFNENLFSVAIANTTTEFNFKLHNSFTENNIVYLATTTFGILKATINTDVYEEIHPEGPLFNDVFDIEVLNNNLWVVYGGYNSSFNFITRRAGFSHFNGVNWINTPYIDNVEYVALSDVSIDPNHENRAFISSYYHGLIEVVDDQIINKFNFTNSGLEIWNASAAAVTLISSSVFDKESNLWVANAYTENKIKKYDVNNQWTSYNVEDVLTGSANGLGEISIDNQGNKWLGTRDFGAIVLSKDGSLKSNLTSEVNRGNLPSDKVKSIIADRNNRIWIGTDLGLVTFTNTSGVFTDESFQANPIIIALDGGTDGAQGEVFLGTQSINTIAVDGADNKWFGTSSSGVLGTNPNARETLYLFNTTNSPLPADNILKIRVDNTTGKVYFATTKGIVVFNNNVAPFGETLGETYAYPNPSTSANQFITIDGRNGTHLPRGTNVKILDSAGYLVHETNVIEGSEIKGGKVIWNKTNLAGRKVASGIYIVLLTLPDKSETSICKIAVIR